MDPLIGSALISAGSSLIGGLLGGSDGPDHLSKRTYQANYNSITGKVAAAKASGISPLYALGAPTMSPAVSTGESSSRRMGETLASMGQDVSRAVAAQQTTAQRALQDLTLQKAALENDWLRAQIASVNGRTLREVGPGMPPGGPINLPQFPDANRTTLYPEPGTTSAQRIQDEYGDVVENVYGTWHFGTDLARNIWYQVLAPMLQQGRKIYYDRIPADNGYRGGSSIGRYSR